MSYIHIDYEYQKYFKKHFVTKLDIIWVKHLKVKE